MEISDLRHEMGQRRKVARDEVEVLFCLGKNMAVGSWELKKRDFLYK